MEGNNREMYQQTSDVVTMQPGPVSYQIPPNDYLGWSIANLLYCCLPLGIAAIIYSLKTRDANHHDNTELAAKRSRIAYALNISASVIGIIGNIVFATINFNRKR